jgi:hypothetical protein
MKFGAMNPSLHAILRYRAWHKFHQTIQYFNIL